MARVPVYRDELVARTLVIARAGRFVNHRGTCRVIDYFVTVMVTFFEMTGGLCGTCVLSPRSNCSVCLPGVNLTVVSVWPLPKCTTLSEAGSGWLRSVGASESINR